VGCGVRKKNDFRSGLLNRGILGRRLTETLRLSMKPNATTGVAQRNLVSAIDGTIRRHNYFQFGLGVIESQSIFDLRCKIALLVIRRDDDRYRRR
jgi:hypothetical protein